MNIGKITSVKTVDENKTFNGMDITAEFLDQKGRVSELTFHYSHATTDVSGKVMSLLSALFNDKPLPKKVSNVKTS